MPLNTITTVTNAIGTVLPFLMEKRRKKITGTEIIEDEPKLSATRTFQLTGGGGLVAYGVSYLEISEKTGLILIGLGIVFALGMEIIKRKL